MLSVTPPVFASLRLPRRPTVDDGLYLRGAIEWAKVRTRIGACDSDSDGLAAHQLERLRLAYDPPPFDEDEEIVLEFRGPAPAYRAVAALRDAAHQHERVWQHLASRYVLFCLRLWAAKIERAALDHHEAAA